MVALGSRCQDKIDLASIYSDSLKYSSTASKKVLEALPGVDSSLAKAIINYGDRKGPFNEIGEIRER